MYIYMNNQSQITCMEGRSCAVSYLSASATGAERSKGVDAAKWLSFRNAN